MSTKYLELDSNYRNRNLPGNLEPGSFSTQISQTGVGTQITAVDPVTYAYPLNVFTVDSTLPNSNFTVTPSIGIGYSSSTTKFVLKDGATSSSSYNNGFFVGGILRGPTGTTGPTEVYRISEWTYMEPSYYMVSTEIPISQADISNSTSFTITVGTSLGTAPSYVFLPTTLGIPNYYSKYVLFNQTRNSSSSITNFDKDTHLATLGSTGLGWQSSDALVVRQQLPKFIGTFSIATLTNIYGTVFSTTPTIVMDSSYINNFFRCYASTTAVSYTIYRITAVVLLVTTRSTGATYYVSDTSGSGIQVYNNQNTTAIYTQYCIVDTSVYPPPSASVTNCEIMGFNIDNYSPFTYNGSLVSQNQSVSYDISLNSLILPNIVLSSGGRIAYYPYVYVEIENVSTTTGANKNMIYSNNPNAYRAIFKVPITDLNHPTTTPFVKLTGNGMVQTMTFKPNADMKVSVKLPDGTIFTPQTSDTSYGQSPNPLLQLSFLFGLKRL